VAEAYKSLRQVERAFRELKSGLDLKPIYHWTEKRIRGHVMVCFLALVLEMALRRKIRDLGEEARYDDLLLDLCQLKAVDLHVDGRYYPARTELTGRNVSFATQRGKRLGPDDSFRKNIKNGRRPP
jgi:hypothetical protein